jgi:hypothetical protein
VAIAVPSTLITVNPDGFENHYEIFPQLPLLLQLHFTQDLHLAQKELII